MRNDKGKCCNKNVNLNSKDENSRCSKLKDSLSSKIPVYVNKNSISNPTCPMLKSNIPKITLCGTSKQSNKNENEKPACCKKVKRIAFEEENSKPTISSPTECTKPKETSAKTLKCKKCKNLQKSSSKLEDANESNTNNESSTLIPDVDETVLPKCKKCKNLQKASSKLEDANKSNTNNENSTLIPDVDETVFQVGQYKVTCNKSSVKFKTNETTETEHITTVSIDKVVPCGTKEELDKKCPSCSEERVKSVRSVCVYTNPNDGMDDKKKIILPEVEIDIGPKKIQTIQIDVKPTELNRKSSGIITIPVKLRFQRLSSPPPERKEPSITSSKTVPSIPDFQKKHVLVYEACDNNTYFQEMYMDELAEDKLEDGIYVKIPYAIVEKFPIIQEPEPVEYFIVEDFNETEDKEKIEEPQVPWYETMECNNYVEPYLQESYYNTGDNVEVQTDLELGVKLLSESINSFSDEYISHGRIPAKYMCRCDKASDLIDWEIIFLPPVNTINIKSDETYDNITETLFSVPPYSNHSDSELEDAEMVPIPEKYNFVYKANNEPYEPYLQTLLKQFPDKPLEPYDKNVLVQLPWKKIVLPNKIKIRKIRKFKLINKLPVCCISAPCIYGRCAKSIASCTCVGGPMSLSNLNSVFQYTDSEQSLLQTLPDQIHKKPDSPLFNSKSMGNNGIQCKNLAGKTKEIHTKIRYNIPQDANTNVFAKITLKDEDNTMNSSPCPYLSTGNNITVKSSKSVTCKYLNSNMLRNIEESNTNIICKCKSGFKEPVVYTPSKPPPIQLKPDPVVAAFQACEAELKPVREALIQVQRKLKNLHMPELDCMFKKDSNDFYDVPNFRCQCPPCGCLFNPNKWHDKSPCLCKSNNVPTTNTRSKMKVKFKHNIRIQKTGNQSKNLNNVSENKKPEVNEGKSNEIKQITKRNKAIQKSGSHYKKLKSSDEYRKPTISDEKYFLSSDDDSKSKEVESLYKKFEFIEDSNKSMCSCLSSTQYNEKDKKYFSSSESSKFSRNTIYYSTSTSPSDNDLNATCSILKKKLKARRRLTSLSSFESKTNNPCPFLEAMEHMMNRKNS